MTEQRNWTELREIRLGLYTVQDCTSEDRWAFCKFLFFHGVYHHSLIQWIYFFNFKVGHKLFSVVWQWTCSWTELVLDQRMHSTVFSSLPSFLLLPFLLCSLDQLSSTITTHWAVYCPHIHVLLKHTYFFIGQALISMRSQQFLYLLLLLLLLLFFGAIVLSYPRVF